MSKNNKNFKNKITAVKDGLSFLNRVTDEAEQQDDFSEPISNRPSKLNKISSKINKLEENNERDQVLVSKLGKKLSKTKVSSIRGITSKPPPRQTCSAAMMSNNSNQNPKSSNRNSFAHRVSHMRTTVNTQYKPKHAMRLTRVSNKAHHFDRRMPELYERRDPNKVMHQNNHGKSSSNMGLDDDAFVEEEEIDRHSKTIVNARHSTLNNDSKRISKSNTPHHHVHTIQDARDYLSTIQLYDKRKKQYILKVNELSELSVKMLKREQIVAFWNAFMLFDHYETCTINAPELAKTLGHLGLPVKIEDIQSIIDCYDENQNGELDFEEYLNLMTNPEVFARLINKSRVSAMHSNNHESNRRSTKSADANNRRSTRKTNSSKSASEKHEIKRPQNFHTPNKPDYKDCIMYEVMNEFFNSKSLSEEQEEQIVSFYAKTMNNMHHHKTYTPHAAHVVHHYADGARSLGLTEKEISCQIEAIKEQQRVETNKQKKYSPYANPMAMIPPIAKNDEYKKKYKVMAANNQKEACAIWRDKPIVNYKVQLPSITVKEEKCAENLKLIRKRTGKVRNKYRIKLSEQQKEFSTQIWDSLRFRKIPNQRLQDIIEEVFEAYTKVTRMQPLKDKPKTVAYSLHDFASIFNENDSDDDSGVYDFLEEYLQAPFIRKRKELAALQN